MSRENKGVSGGEKDESKKQYTSYDYKNYMGYEGYDGYKGAKKTKVFTITNFEVKCSEVRAKDIVFKKEEYDALLQIAKEDIYEWGVYLRFEEDEKEIKVVEIIVPEQKTSTATFEVKNPENGEFGILHSHHNMGAGFSSVDNEGINLNNRFSVVINSKGEYSAIVKEKTPCGKYTTLEAKVFTISDVSNVLVERLRNELKEKRQEEVFYGGNYSEEYEDFTYPGIVCEKCKGEIFSIYPSTVDDTMLCEKCYTEIQVSVILSKCEKCGQYVNHIRSIQNKEVDICLNCYEDSKEKECKMYEGGQRFCAECGSCNDLVKNTNSEITLCQGCYAEKNTWCEID